MATASSPVEVPSREFDLSDRDHLFEIVDGQLLESAENGSGSRCRLASSWSV